MQMFARLFTVHFLSMREQPKNKCRPRFLDRNPDEISELFIDGGNAWCLNQQTHIDLRIGCTYIACRVAGDAVRIRYLKFPHRVLHARAQTHTVNNCEMNTLDHSASFSFLLSWWICVSRRSHTSRWRTLFHNFEENNLRNKQSVYFQEELSSTLSFSQRQSYLLELLLQLHTEIHICLMRITRRRSAMSERYYTVLEFIMRGTCNRE